MIQAPVLQDSCWLLHTGPPPALHRAEYELGETVSDKDKGEGFTKFTITPLELRLQRMKRMGRARKRWNELAAGETGPGEESGTNKQ